MKYCTFYADDWAVFSKVLPKGRRVVGKAHIVAVEQGNGNTRHHLGWFTWRIGVVSKKLLWWIYLFGCGVL
ncbi:MAG: hypothetical protein LBC12_03320 [Nitrososphaerota archaeon]|nr:hypothetical protein [Nitrososphaerota archaeon]